MCVYMFCDKEKKYLIRLQLFEMKLTYLLVRSPKFIGPCTRPKEHLTLLSTLDSGHFYLC